jgi:hypothetical protein
MALTRIPAPRRLPRVAAGLALLLAATTAHATCRADPRATVPLELSHDQPIVTVTLNGQPAPLVLDTGGGRTLLTVAEVQLAKLPLDDWVSTPLIGAGNRLEDRRNVTLRSLALGGVPLQRRGLARVISLAVTAQRLDMDAKIAGLLGADMLSRYDLDLDFPAGRLTLYTVTGCTGRFLPWTAPYDAIPARLIADDGLLIPVLIDGHPLDAQIDTGSVVSLIDARGLYRLGLTPQALAHDPTGEATAIGGAFRNQSHRFSELRVGAALIASPTLRVAAVRRPGVDMLLGMDILASRRIWISYATAQVFIAGPPD